MTKISREEVEQQIIYQVRQQWMTHRDAHCFVVMEKRYPAFVMINDNVKRLAIFKEKQSGPIFFETLDKLIYGYVLTKYKIEDERIIEFAEKSLIGESDEVIQAYNRWFESIFE